MLKVEKSEKFSAALIKTYTERILRMTIKYYKLFDLLARKGGNKSDLRAKTGIASQTMAKLSKNGNVTTDVIDRICAVMDCQPGDIMEYIEDDKPETERD